MRTRLIPLALALALMPPSASAEAAPVAGKTPPGSDGDGRSVHTVFVHGLDPYDDASKNCALWKPMTRALASWGHDFGKFHPVKYYGHDENCRNDLHKHGSHSQHYPSGHVYENNGHNQEASIRHLGYHLAWYLNNGFAKKGIPVQIVAHSMGGLMTRYALAQIERGHPKFPSTVTVQDVVTLGTPHDGAGFARTCRYAKQCQEIIPDNDFLDWLNTYANHPDGFNGTDWTTIGSHADDLVEPNSAIHMDSDHKVKYFSQSGVEHSDYYKDNSDVRSADVEWFDRDQQWYEWYEAPWPVRWTDHAIYHYSW